MEKTIKNAIVRGRVKLNRYFCIAFFYWIIFKVPIMDMPEIFKFIVISILILILLSLTKGFHFLMKEKEESKKMVTTLTIRILLSIGLFLFMFFGYFMGWVTPIQ